MRQNFPHECYIPLAKPIGKTYQIDPTCLKAIRVKDEATALAILKESSYRVVDEAKFLKMANQ